MVKWVFKVLPAFVFYTDRFVPKRFGGVTYGIFVFIRKKYRNDRGLLEHELVHVKQFYRTLGLHALLYSLWKRYRLRSEVSAYRVQLSYPPALEDPERYRDLFAGFVAQKYGLSITKEQARELLL